eukprot:XP_001709848.1 Hypothetical protein GL50803_35522 [Giardia lamblia ATCC 50803]
MISPGLQPISHGQRWCICNAVTTTWMESPRFNRSQSSICLRDRAIRVTSDTCFPSNYPTNHRLDLLY